MIDRERVRLQDVRPVELLDYSVRACLSGWVEDV